MFRKLFGDDPIEALKNLMSIEDSNGEKKLAKSSSDFQEIYNKEFIGLDKSLLRHNDLVRKIVLQVKELILIHTENTSPGERDLETIALANHFVSFIRGRYKFYTIEWLEKHDLLESECPDMTIEKSKPVKDEPYFLKPILTFKEACKYTGLSKSWLYKKTSSGEVAHYKPDGKKIYFKREELEAWLLRNKVLSKEEIQRKANNIE